MDLANQRALTLPARNLNTCLLRHGTHLFSPWGPPSSPAAWGQAGRGRFLFLSGDREESVLLLRGTHVYISAAGARLPGSTSAG